MMHCSSNFSLVVMVLCKNYPVHQRNFNMKTFINIMVCKNEFPRSAIIIEGKVQNQAKLMSCKQFLNNTYSQILIWEIRPCCFIVPAFGISGLFICQQTERPNKEKRTIIYHYHRAQCVCVCMHSHANCTFYYQNLHHKLMQAGRGRLMLL